MKRKITKEQRELKELKKRALYLWSEKVKKYGYCRKCGSEKKTLNAHHILSKKHYQKYLFSTDNGIALCWNCHRFFAHLESIAFYVWLGDEYPELLRWALDHVYDTDKYKWTAQEIESVIELLSV